VVDDPRHRGEHHPVVEVVALPHDGRQTGDLASVVLAALCEQDVVFKDTEVVDLGAGLPDRVGVEVVGVDRPSLPLCSEAWMASTPSGGDGVEERATEPPSRSPAGGRIDGSPGSLRRQVGEVVERSKATPTTTLSPTTL
jgi:hypothetical protein